MSCRVLAGDEKFIAQPMDWRQAARTGRSMSPHLYGKPTPEQQARSADDPDVAERLNKLRREAEQEVRAAYERGFREGEAAGTQRASERVQGVIEKLGKTLDEIRGYRGRLRREAEVDLLRLSLAIARRVLRRELTVDPQALLGLVKAALEKLDSRESVKIRIHPQLAEMLSAQLGGENRLIEVISDPSLDLGGAIVDTSRGSFDASADTQLVEIERGLVDVCL